MLFRATSNSRCCDAIVSTCRWVVFAECGDRFHHLSDFVLAVAVIDRDIDGAGGDFAHGFRHAWIGLMIDLAKLTAISTLINNPAIPPNASQRLWMPTLVTMSSTTEVVR